MPGSGGLLDRDHALLADAVERLGDGLADPLVLLAGDRRHVAQVVARRTTGRAWRRRSSTTRSVAILDAAPQQHRVGALLDRAHALAHDPLGQQRRGRRAVAGEVATSCWRPRARAARPCS